MQGKIFNQNIKTPAIVFFTTLVLLFIGYIPIHRVNIIKSQLYKLRYNQIQYLNSQSYIIPETINTIKGHIIHNEKALKDIVYINLLTKSPNNNIKEVYDNQIKIFNITKNLIDNANQNSILSKNEKFKELQNKFNEIYSKTKKDITTCQTLTKKLQDYMSFPVYKKIINTKNINEIICID